MDADTDSTDATELADLVDSTDSADSMDSADLVDSYFNLHLDWLGCFSGVDYFYCYYG